MLNFTQVRCGAVQGFSNTPEVNLDSVEEKSHVENQAICDPPHAVPNTESKRTQEQTTSADSNQSEYRASENDSNRDNDKELDSNDSVLDVSVFDFYAYCHRKPTGVKHKRCSNLQLSQYCSIYCQRENWNEHKVALPFPNHIHFLSYELLQT